MRDPDRNQEPEVGKELRRHGIVLPGFDTGLVQIPPDYESGHRIEPGDPIELTLVADPQARNSSRAARQRAHSP